MTLRADLHMHTTSSDGTFSPTELVNRAKNKEIDIIAITDHDTVEGIEEAIEAAKKLNIKVIPGIELSTTYNGENIHIIGYFKGNGYKDPSLINFLEDLKEKRFTRAKKIVENMKSIHNIHISFDEIMKNSDGVIARPHIAREILKVRPDLTWDQVFYKYLSDGCPAYIPSVKVPLEEGIALLKKYDAIVSLAHPTIIRKTPVKKFMEFNFDAMEAIYPENKFGETGRFISLCNEHNILVTAGSDFHGNLTQDTMHHDIGTVALEGVHLENFLKGLDLEL
ncbi:PHP domain-containing protein [Oceanirhabdus sp. W0125-5]|uniref:PHP domain-containing protein n=1 Tax=Oceanirhabdus sp. W0125-5 TaxID=2999116 RepID=UPI0022F33BC2|nr:PHP domain-containing protein [Oceanirhabdus sp. W0125-5]WBW96002.1 PHP domain-containing protein [Oceanirhabdus sp. W0125-5]